MASRLTELIVDKVGMKGTGTWTIKAALDSQVPVPTMAAAVDALFSGATADHARTTCRQYKISYLVSRIYDPAWQNKQSWVWTLPPAVSDPEFRALNCERAP